MWRGPRGGRRGGCARAASGGRAGRWQRDGEFGRLEVDAQRARAVVRVLVARERPPPEHRLRVEVQLGPLAPQRRDARRRAEVARREQRARLLLLHGAVAELRHALQHQQSAMLHTTYNSVLYKFITTVQSRSQREAHRAGLESQVLHRTSEGGGLLGNDSVIQR